MFGAGGLVRRVEAITPAKATMTNWDLRRTQLSSSRMEAQFPKSPVFIPKVQIADDPLRIRQPV